MGKTKPPWNLRMGTAWKIIFIIKKWTEEIRAKLGGHLFEGKIGVDIWTPMLVKSLQAAFPKAEFVEGKPVLARAQSVMTKDEIECQRAATMITEAGFQALFEKMRPGVCSPSLSVVS